jgi:hypothetical protein
MTSSSSTSAAASRHPADPANGGEGDFVDSHRSAWLAWLLVSALAACLTAASTYEALRRYQELRSAWSWDLAYYNQWFWALTHGERQVTVRPVSAYAQEGPSIWKMNYLSLIRLVLVPIYQIRQDPRTLLVIQNVLFWWVIPAAYTLVRSESGSDSLALSAAFLVPLTPLLWPLVWNDFRELQLATSFVLWAIQGIRSRSAGLAALGIAAMLACRQEYAVIVATFAFLPAREPEPLGVTLRWRQATLLVGLVWFLFGFFGYLKWMVGRPVPDLFIDQFLGPKASPGRTLGTAIDTLLVGMGAWAILACLAPRIAILAVPWIWAMCSGRWAMRILSTTEWHHVRYLMPMAILVLAAGLVGYARLGSWLLLRGRGGRAGLAVVWVCAAISCGLGLRSVVASVAHVPVKIDRNEADQVWSWIGEVGPADAVVAAYEVSAPLSSRRRLFGYGLYEHRPPGFPRLGPDFRWLFIERNYPFLKLLLDNGFEIVHQGEFLTIARRVATTSKSKI